MSRIKSEYEQLISVLEHGREEDIYLRGKLVEIISTPATLANYQSRAKDLQTK